MDYILKNDERRDLYHSSGVITVFKYRR